MHKLQLLKSFFDRIVTNIKKFDHITPVREDPKWLTVSEALLYRDVVMA